MPGLPTFDQFTETSVVVVFERESDELPDNMQHSPVTHAAETSYTVTRRKRKVWARSSWIWNFFNQIDQRFYFKLCIKDPAHYSSNTGSAL